MNAVYDKKRGKWYSRITLEGRRRHLGFRDTEREAQRDYDQEKFWFEARKRIEEVSKNFTLGNYNPPYIEDDTSFQWVETRKALRALVYRIRVWSVLAFIARRRK